MTLNTKLNASGSGVGRFVKAVGRSMVSGESTFITQVFAQSNNAYLALAHDSPGQVIPYKRQGFFVMTTQGQGTLLANAYGSIKKLC